MSACEYNACRQGSHHARWSQPVYSCRPVVHLNERMESQKCTMKKSRWRPATLRRKGWSRECSRPTLGRSATVCTHCGTDGGFILKQKRGVKHPARTARNRAICTLLRSESERQQTVQVGAASSALGRRRWGEGELAARNAVIQTWLGRGWTRKVQAPARLLRLAYYFFASRERVRTTRHDLWKGVGVERRERASDELQSIAARSIY